MLWQGQLHQDTVHRGISIQFVQLIQESLLRSLCGHSDLVADHADFFGLAYLVADIDLTRRVFAHQNDR